MMKHIKSYEQFLTESKTAKEIEKKINKMGEPEDDSKQMADTAYDTSEGPTTPPEELDAEAEKEKENETKKSKAAHLAKKMKDSSEGEEGVDAEIDETYEHHDGEFDERLLKMSVNDVLDYLEKKDKTAYSAIEKALGSAFKDMTKADESWFTTMTS